MELRHYQISCINAVYEWFKSGRKDDPLCVLATGTGKSVIIAEFIKEVIQTYPDQRVLCCIDTKELVRQNYEKLVQIWPFSPVGIYSAGLKRKQANMQVLFCGIQSVYSKAEIIGHTDILIVDEAHMLSPNSIGMWQTFICGLKEINPKLRLIGFTATPYRLDSGLLYEGSDALFGGVAYEYGIREGVEEKFLSEIIPKRMDTRLSTEGVKKRGGDFIESQLQEAVNKEPITEAAVKEIVEYGEHRKSWLVFSAGVDHAYSIANEIRKYGYSCEVIEGKTNSGDRDKCIQEFKEGKIRCLVNNSVLTKGFDAPNIDLIASLRPTESPVLWTQMVGRGLRIADGKENCLLLDFSENVQRFGFIDKIVFKKKKKDGDEPGIPPMKECPTCQTIVHAAVRFCPECDHYFEPPEPEHSTKAYDGAILSTQVIPEEKKVTFVIFAKHDKKNPPSLRVEYWCGLMERYSEWICFEHQNFARQRAEDWWNKYADPCRLKTMEEVELYRSLAPSYVPNTVDEALALKNAIHKPAYVTVRQEGQFFRVVGRSDEELTLEPEFQNQTNQQLEDDIQNLIF